MKVLYWNVCSEASPEAIVRETSELVQQENIDVVCLQEVPYITQEQSGKRVQIPLSAILAQELGMVEHFEHTRTIRQSDKRLRGYGTALLSRSGFAEVEAHTLRDDRFAYMTPHPDNRRVLVVARTLAEPDIVVNVEHASYALPLKLGSKGMAQERSTLTELLKQQMQKYQVVFGGDLNTIPGKTIDKLLEAIGFTNVVEHTVKTFRSRHWYAGHIKRNLDRVFVTTGLQAKSIIGERRQSDHNPVIVEIERRI